MSTILHYAAPVWFPNVSQSAVNGLQAIQNSALRTATGSLKMASIDHLHSETSTLPLHRSLSLRCQQFLAGALRLDHPSYPTVTSYSGPRNMKHTLQSRFLPSISHLLQEDIMPSHNYRAALCSLHTEAMTGAIAETGHNRVLGTRPPQVDPSELLLGRSQRTALSQLRSSHSGRLNSYLHRVGWAPSPTCPDCQQSDHTVSHVFSCPSAPTQLTPVDLWKRPQQVVSFLSSTPAFAFLQPPSDPPAPTGPGPPARPQGASGLPRW